MIESDFPLLQPYIAWQAQESHQTFRNSLAKYSSFSSKPSFQQMIPRLGCNLENMAVRIQAQHQRYGIIPPRPEESVMIIDIIGY